MYARAAPTPGPGTRRRLTAADQALTALLQLSPAKAERRTWLASARSLLSRYSAQGRPLQSASTAASAEIENCVHNAEAPSQQPVARTTSAARRALQDRTFVLRRSDERLIFESVGPVFAGRLGLDPGELIGRDVAAALPEVVALRLRAAASKCERERRATRWFQAMPLHRGRRTWQLALTPSKDPNGDRFLGLMRELGPAAEARSELSNRSAFPNRPRVFHFVSTRNGALEWLSREMLEFLDLPVDAPLEEAFAGIHPGDLFSVNLLTEIGTPASLLMQLRMRNGDGCYKRFWIRGDLVEGLAGHRWYGLMVEQPAPAVGSSRPLTMTAGRSWAPSRPGWTLDVDPEWRLVSATPGTLEQLGVAPESVLGRDIRNTLLCSAPLHEAILRALEAKEDSVVEAPQQAHPPTWTEFQVRSWVGGVRVNVQDITERRAAAAVMEAPEHLHGSADAASAEMLLLDETGVVVSCNEAYRTKVREFPTDTPVEPHGCDYPSLCSLSGTYLDPEVIRNGIADLAAGRIQRFVHTFGSNLDHQYRVIRVRISPVELGGATRLIVLQEDLTDLARTEAALRATTVRLLNAQQEERQRIAIELHDSTTQHLAAIGIGMARLRRIAGAGAQVQEVLDDVSQALGEATKEIRVMSYLMRPAVLRRNGLAGSVEIFLKGFGRRTGLNTGFRSEGQVDEVNEAVAHAAYRVIQEALSNVYRHANAQGVEVDLASRSGVLTVRVADDGAGIDMPQVTEGGRIGVGISGMRARTAQLGGEFQISSDGAGTVVMARLPCRTATDGSPQQDGD